MKKRELYNKVLLPDFSTKTLLLMLNWTITLTFLLVLEVSANSYSQNVKVNLDFQNVKFKRALTILEQKGNIRLLYSEENLPADKFITLSVKDTPVMDVLGMILKDTELKFRELENGLVVISPQNNELKDIVVKGQVTDSKGETLPGVSIKLKGTSIGATTDMNGNYSINVPENAILIFSYIGYLTKEIPINDQTSLNVILEMLSTSIKEIVVTALGIKRDVKSLTYSTQNVSTKELTEARELNVVNSLQGKVAGLSVNSSGTGVGAESRVVLRGNRSISGDSQPLYIIDGVPIRGNPSNLSLDNIASINILKGPNAAALYGSAAQNGAIVIETKNGQGQGINISFNNTYMVMDPVLSIPFQNVYGQGQAGIYQKTSEAAWGPKMDGKMVDTWSLNPADANTQYAYSPQASNKIDAYNTGSTYASSLFASIGSEKIQSAFTYTFNEANGILPNNKLQRHNLSLRINNKFSERLSMDSKIDYINQQINNKLAEGESNFNPNRQIYTMPSNINLADAKQFEYLGANGVLRQNFWNSTTTTGANPFWTLNRNPNLNLVERVIAMTSLTYNFSDALKLIVRGSYDGASGTTEEKLYNDTYVRAPDGRYTLNKSNDH